MQTLNDPQVILDAALAYGQRGWLIIPTHAPAAIGLCACKDGKDCSSPGKRPYIVKFAQNATCEEHQIRNWWDPAANRFAGANIALFTGARSQCFVLDLDTADALAYALEANANENYDNPFPRTITKKGEHWFFHHPAFHIITKANVMPDTMPGMDIRGDGGNGLVILPPSTHIKGVQYEADFMEPLDKWTPAQLPTAPKWLLDHLWSISPDNPENQKPATPPPAPRVTEKNLRSASPTPVKHNGRNCIDCSQPTQNGWPRCGTCHAAKRKEALLESNLKHALGQLSRAIEGSRNETLSKYSYYIGMIVANGHLSESEAESEIRSAASHIFADEPKKSESTMTRQLANGMSNPSGLDLPDFTDGNKTNRPNKTNRSSNLPPPPPAPPYVALNDTPPPYFDGNPDGYEIEQFAPPPMPPSKKKKKKIKLSVPAVTKNEKLAYKGKDFVKTCLYRNELGDAELLTTLYRDRLLYDHNLSEWFVWNGVYWEKDERSLIRLLIGIQLASQYFQAADEFNKQAVLEENAALEKVVEEAKKRTSALRSRRRASSILHFAEPLAGIAGDEWNKGNWVIAAKNHYVDLKTGEGITPDPTLLINTPFETEWQGIDASATRWQQFLIEIFQNNPNRTEIISFLQRLFGYSLTGLGIEHIFPIFWGARGRNGKDTMFNALRSVFGAFSGPVSDDVLMDSGSNRTHRGAASPHLVALDGMRLLWVPESPKSGRLNINQVKRLTGGSVFKARGLFKKETEIVPSWVLGLMTNYRPDADSQDDAFWERAVLIEFNERFVDTPDPQNPYEHPKDPYLLQKLEEEKPGILAWLVRGCLAYQEQGLNVPDCIRLNTQSYRVDVDEINDFINDCCVESEKARIGVAALYKKYKLWQLSESDTKPLKRKDFKKRIAARFGDPTKSKGIMKFKGIGIATPIPDAE